MSLEQDIIDLGQTITGYGVAHQTKLDELAAARDGANAATASVLTLQNLDQSRYIYFKAGVDDTNNDGLSSANPVASFERVAALFKSGQLNVVMLMSDISFDYLLHIRNSPSKIAFYGRTDNDDGYQRRSAVFVDSLNAPTWPGGFYFWTTGGMEINTFEVDIVMNYAADQSPFHVSGGHYFAHIQNGIFSRTGTSAKPFFGGSFAGHFEVTNMVIDASAAGYIIKAVAASADPNLVPGISANFTQG